MNSKMAFIWLYMAFIEIENFRKGKRRHRVTTLVRVVKL